MKVANSDLNFSSRGRRQSRNVSIKPEQLGHARLGHTRLHSRNAEHVQKIPEMQSTHFDAESSGLLETFLPPVLLFCVAWRCPDHVLEEGCSRSMGQWPRLVSAGSVHDQIGRELSKTKFWVTTTATSNI